MTAIAICEHIKDNGDTCGSPALTGYDFCYFHQRLRYPRHRPGDFEYKLPILDTPESILMATQHITQATLDGVLEERRGRLVLSALRLAKATLKEMNKDKKPDVGTGKNVLGDTKPDVGTGKNVLGDKKPDVGTGKNVLGEEKPGVGTGALARATRAQLAVSTPALTATAELSGPPAAAAAHEGSPRSEPWVSVTSTSKAPAGVTDKKPPLSAHQLKLMTKILRRGPSHPRFAAAARILDSQISRGKTA